MTARSSYSFSEGGPICTWNEGSTLYIVDGLLEVNPTYTWNDSIISVDLVDGQ